MLGALIDTIKGLLGLGPKLPTFGGEIGKQSVAGKTVRIPYSQVISYYGYAKKGAEPDEVIDGKKFWFIYIWVPLVAPELGVRMMSPVADLGVPGEGDFTSETWPEAAKDPETFFDTWICLERADGIMNPGDVEEKVKGAKWTRYAYNDDSSEVPPIPTGQNYNSLLRHVSDPGDPLKALVRGLYRIGFSTFKTGEVQGSFLAQIGAPLKLPGCFLGTDANAIAKQAAEYEAKAKEKASEAADKATEGGGDAAAAPAAEAEGGGDAPAA